MFVSSIHGIHNLLAQYKRSPIEKLFVKNLTDKQSVQSTFLAKNKTLLKDKKGNSYISLYLSDKTGSIDAKIWDNVEQANNTFASGDIIEVKGTVKLFQNKKQFIIHKLAVQSSTDVDFEDYVGATEVSPEANLAEVLKIAESISSPHIRQLVVNTLKDPQIHDKLLTSAAAKSIHHVQRGGLIEHIHSICKIMNYISSHYPNLNRDFLIFGAVFHDIGKIWELEWTSKGVRYTDSGRLIGHLVMSAELVEKKASQILGFPEELKMVCKHIILSHHGKLEYGSPKVPMVLEAYVVWMIDDLDSKIDSLEHFIKQDASGDGHWSSFFQLYGRHFFTKDFREPPES